ncbi:MAG TPA: flavodoxin [Thermotogota bacterium]|nr:flavodoxin [Thermotogota bacterium]HPJ88852.1 flavodoxin [Thermotogota bacterium]
MSKVLVVYWSQTGNTEMMAEAVAEGAKSKGAEVELLQVSEANTEMIKFADAIALGCPSMGVEALEESEMEPFVDEIESVVSGKSLGLFGSYDWGDGQWMREWQERMEDCGADLVEDGLIVHLTPDDAAKKNCKALGEKLTG